ncbi:hypothetical protein [Streptomyces sp. MJM1172]|uniref:hypothetical protein n=1 Tax=Streptomyces sp. MJM1172 TaxID=1703926 RepID=UPI00093C69AB|nr:hypothetical protein [Streptomyces sp. MJM1172]
MTGASSGVGFELVRPLGERGFDPIVNSGDENRLRSAAEEIAAVREYVEAVTLAAALRDPTPLDARLLHLLGPGGSVRVDWMTGADHGGDADAVWRTWVDETVAGPPASSRSPLSLWTPTASSIAARPARSPAAPAPARANTLPLP